MNCLTYLLNLWKEGHRFTIFYDGNHCCGINEKKLFDLNNTFKKDFLLGFGARYEKIENCHKKETIKKIFDLNLEQQQIIDDYYARNN